MNDPGALVLASSYVAPDGLSFWAWSEGGQVVTWARGADGEAPGPTIAFQPELAQALARLAPRGLPSFQALVLLLGACRDGWLEAADASFAPLVSAAEVVDPHAERFVPLLAQVLEALTVVGRLPPRLRSVVATRAALAELVLEGAPAVVAAEFAPRVVVAIARGVEPAERGDALTPRVRELVRDLEALRDGLAGLEPERLAELLDARARTGLDDVPAPAPIEVEAPEDEPPARRVARLIDTLQDDPELGGLARLARDLRAAVHVPRAVTQHDDLPLGGVSDITNRGPLDRLLVSELAHDELTFSVRVATGEALYLRREAPPRGPEGGRAVLLDAGVRLWGTSRVFATAVGLAIAAGSGKAAVRCQSGRGGALVDVDLTTRAGLLAHLEALDPAPHVGALLPAFAADEDGERLLVTHEDALDDPELRRALGEVTQDGPLLVASVTRDGSYRLRSFGARGSKLLSQARLDLDALLAPRKARGAPPLATDDRLPAILARRPLPLRLPCAVPPSRARHHPALGVVALSRDGRLLWFLEPFGKQGGLELTDQVPLGPLQWLDLELPGVVRALVGPTSGELRLVSCNLHDDAPPVTSKLACVAPPLAVVKSGAALLLVFPRHVHVVALDTGQAAPGLELPPGVTWRMGRYFTDRLQWLALVADGLRPVLEPLSGYARGAIALWDRARHEGPWGLEPDGVLLSGSPVAKIERLSPAEVTYTGVQAISQDGERLWLRALRRGSVVNELLEVETDARTPLRSADPSVRGGFLEPTLTRALAGAPQVRTRLQGLAVDGQGALALVSRRRRVHALTLGADGRLTLRGVPPGEAVLRAWRPFEPRDPLPGAAWSLAVATWRDGSRAFLDGRGLLHLVPVSGVEVTLVLAEGPLAAWTTDGELTGPAYFTGVVGGDVPRGGDEAARAVLRHVARFCEAIR